MDDVSPTTPPPPSPTSASQKNKVLFPIILGVTILIILGSLVYFLTRQTSTPQSQPLQQTETSGVKQKTEQDLFIVSAGEENQYAISLYDPDQKTVVKQKTIDLASLGWDLSPLTTRFASSMGAEPFQYDRTTDTIFLVLVPMPGGIGGYKPGDALPDPPFISAVYTTTFDPTDPLTELFRLDDTYISYVTLSPSRNRLIYVTQQDEIESFWEFNIQDKTTKLLTTIQNEENRLNEYSDISISDVESKIYQMVITSARTDQNRTLWANERLHLHTIDIPKGTTDSVLVFEGDALESGIEALSPNKNLVAFYTGLAPTRLLKVKNLERNEVIDIPLLERLGNVSLYWSSDSKNLVIGSIDGWIYYDIEMKRSKKIPTDYVMLFQSDKYIVGRGINSNINLYDIGTQAETDLGINANSVMSLQWR